MNTLSLASQNEQRNQHPKLFVNQSTITGHMIDSLITKTVIGASATTVSVTFVLLTYLLGQYQSLVNQDDTSPVDTDPYRYAIWTLVAVVWIGSGSVYSLLAGIIWNCPNLQFFGIGLFVLVLLILVIMTTGISWKTLSGRFRS